MSTAGNSASASPRRLSVISSLKVGVGDVVDLYVVEAGDQVTLAPSLKPSGRGGGGGGGSGAMRQVREALASGMPVSGRVTGVNAGGISVDVGGVRGFCPISQIEAGFCSDASTYVGKTLEFLVTKVESGRGGAVLSRRQLLRRAEQENAKQLIATLKPGDEREGTVARLEAFGVFVDLGGVDGLVHVSEIRHGHTGHPREAVRPGETVKVKVLKIEPGKDGQPRIALSIKAAQPDPWVGIENKFPRGTRITADLLENPGKLRAIVRAGVGVDNIDVAAATRHGIVVMNTPGGNTVSAADSRSRFAIFGRWPTRSVRPPGTCRLSTGVTFSSRGTTRKPR